MKKQLIYPLFFILFIVSGGCSDGADSDQKNEYRFYNSIEVDGRQRTYLLNLPPDYYSGSENFALVIAMHGTGGNAYQFENDYKFSQKANHEQFIAVYPEGVENDGFLRVRTWNAGYCCDYAADNNIGDVKFISELIDFLSGKYKIDTRRVYATGMSNGGMMAYRIASEMPERIAAIAPVSCSMVTGQFISPTQPVPVLHLHSVLDTKIPQQGGVGIGGYYFPPLDSVMNVWANVNECAAGPEIVVDDDEFKLTRWTGCNNDVVVEYYLTKDGGHAWPGGTKSRDNADEPSHVIDANELIWEFFQNYQLP
jgi:polyhydroxybutyrate depolymerase